jgi:hypothetical protein
MVGTTETGMENHHKTEPRPTTSDIINTSFGVTKKRAGAIAAIHK